MDDFLELVKEHIATLALMELAIVETKETRNGTRPQLEEPNAWVPSYVARCQEGNPIPARVDYPTEVRDFESERARTEQARGRTVDDQF